jgi:hypothetical protein
VTQPMPPMMDGLDPKMLAASYWYGYGRWAAPYWFVGMEPGGTDDHASYESWQRLGGAKLIDCRQHHLDTKFFRWHVRQPPKDLPTQPTWRRLIQLLLAYQGKPADLEAVRSYQPKAWGAIDGETAVVELGALHAPSLRTKVDRKTYRDARIDVLGERLRNCGPTFAVFYGYDYQPDYERIVGGRFGPDNFAWSASTLCALAPGPTAPCPKTSPDQWGKDQWWIDLGRRMRVMVDERRKEPVP